MLGARCGAKQAENPIGDKLDFFLERVGLIPSIVGYLVCYKEKVLVGSTTKKSIGSFTRRCKRTMGLGSMASGTGSVRVYGLSLGSRAFRVWGWLGVMVSR